MSTPLEVLPLDPPDSHEVATGAFYITVPERTPDYPDDRYVRLKLDSIPANDTNPLFEIEGLWSVVLKILRETGASSGIHYLAMNDIIDALGSAIRTATFSSDPFGFLPFVIDSQQLGMFASSLHDARSHVADYPDALPVLDLPAEPCYIRFRFAAAGAQSSDDPVASFKIDLLPSENEKAYSNIPWPTLRWAIVNAQGASSLNPDITSVTYAIEKAITRGTEGQLICVCGDAGLASRFIDSVDEDPGLQDTVQQSR